MILYSALYDERDPFGCFSEVKTVWDEDQLKEGGVLVLWGGEDISPSLYGQKKSSYTYASNKPSKRDVYETQLAKAAVDKGIPIIGVCRGAQLMCALSGGSLIQDVTGHTGGRHNIVDKNGLSLITNTIHHQMMNLKNTKHELIAWAPEPLSSHYIVEGDIEVEVEVEPEIVFFKETNALAIQGHPEYLTPSNAFVKYCTSLIKEKFNVVS